MKMEKKKRGQSAIANQNVVFGPIRFNPLESLRIPRVLHTESDPVIGSC